MYSGMVIVPMKALDSIFNDKAEIFYVVEGILALGAGRLVSLGRSARLPVNFACRRRGYVSTERRELHQWPALQALTLPPR